MKQRRQRSGLTHDREPSIRLQLTLKAGYADRLETLRKNSDLPYAEIIREALRLYDNIKTLGPGKLSFEQSDGTKILIVT